jgi:hypothetical protein
MKTRWLTIAGLTISALAALDTWAISNASALHLSPSLSGAVMLAGTALAAIGRSLASPPAAS